MRRLQSALLIAALGVPSAVPVSAARAVCTPYTDFKPFIGGTRVAQICHNAQPVPGIRALVTPPNGAPDSREVDTNWTIPAGTSIAVPDATYIDLVDSRASFRSSPGMRVTVAEKGYVLDGAGHAQFAVVRAMENALDFFGVKVGRFIAAVPGTVFGIDLSEPSSVTFTVSEGRVAVTREVSVVLDRERRSVDGILIARYLTPDDPPLTYARAPETYAHFKNVNAARDTFTHDLQAAEKIGDPALVIAARQNLDVLNASGPKHGGHGLLPALLGAALLGVIVSEATKGSGSASPSPSPSPSPTPTPHPYLRYVSTPTPPGR